jgi:predicted esterase YcpF (UPF0227 family)
MSGDEIRAYVLLGCLLAAYPVLRGVKAVSDYIGPEVVTYDSCDYVVEKLNSYGDIKTIRPLNKDAEACIAKRKKDNDESVVLDYQQAHRKLRYGGVNQ